MNIFFPQHLLTFIETSHPLVQIGLLLLFGYLGGRIANYFKFPRVSGYIVIGVVLSPSVSGLFHEELYVRIWLSSLILPWALSPFSIGGSLELKNLKGSMVLYCGLISHRPLPSSSLLRHLYPWSHRSLSDQEFHRILSGKATFPWPW